MYNHVDNVFTVDGVTDRRTWRVSATVFLFVLCFLSVAVRSSGRGGGNQATFHLVFVSPFPSREPQGPDLLLAVRLRARECFCVSDFVCVKCMYIYIDIAITIGASVT